MSIFQMSILWLRLKDTQVSISNFGIGFWQLHLFAFWTVEIFGLKIFRFYFVRVALHIFSLHLAK